MIRYYSNILYDGSPEINAHIATHIATYAHEECRRIKKKNVFYLEQSRLRGCYELDHRNNRAYNNRLLNT